MLIETYAILVMLYGHAFYGIEQVLAGAQLLELHDMAASLQSILTKQLSSSTTSLLPVFNHFRKELVDLITTVFDN